MSDVAASYSLAARGDVAKREYWSSLALRESPGVGPRRLAMLLSFFGSAYEAVCSVDAWQQAGVPAKCAAEFRKETWRPAAGLEWAAAKSSPCGILCWSEEGYPVWLRSIADPPPFLYFFGDISLLCNPAVAVVGMRSCSEEGLKATVHICRGLAEAGITIVSGMARGIDRAAHIAGLEGVGGSIGVLGGGIDHIYPKENRDLYDLMRQRGLLVSESPPGKVPEEGSFPIRNRIISGVSRAVVVMEAAVRSGSLNTAKHALEQNRELMAVPGPVTASSAKGCQELVRRGAKAVFCADDILREMVSHLQEHIRQGVLAREAERFQRPVAGKQGATSVAEADLPEYQKPVLDGLLPFRTQKAEKRKHDGTSAETSVKGVYAAREYARSSVLPQELDELEAQIYSLVSRTPSHMDDICRALGQNAGIISRVVTMLEVRGIVKRLPGMFYTVF